MKNRKRVEDFIFAGCRSARDYQTLLKATRDTGKKLVIVAVAAQYLNLYNHTLSRVQEPSKIG